METQDTIDTTETTVEKPKRTRVVHEKAADAVELKEDKDLLVSYAKKLLRILVVPNTKAGARDELEKQEGQVFSYDKKYKLWQLVKIMENKGYVVKVAVEGKKRELVQAAPGISEDDITL